MRRTRGSTAGHPHLLPAPPAPAGYRPKDAGRLHLRLHPRALPAAWARTGPDRNLVDRAVLHGRPRFHGRPGKPFAATPAAPRDRRDTAGNPAPEDGEPAAADQPRAHEETCRDELFSSRHPWRFGHTGPAGRLHRDGRSHTRHLCGLPMRERQRRALHQGGAPASSRRSTGRRVPGRMAKHAGQAHGVRATSTRTPSSPAQAGLLGDDLMLGSSAKDKPAAIYHEPMDPYMWDYLILQIRHGRSLFRPCPAGSGRTRPPRCTGTSATTSSSSGRAGGSGAVWFRADPSQRDREGCILPAPAGRPQGRDPTRVPPPARRTRLYICSGVRAISRTPHQDL